MDSDTLTRSEAHLGYPREPGLSYKFQRLRERIRSAVNNGELAGKLPGERILARRFRVNAKTLSKALTDLAAEGVLERAIGRGTYVSGQTPAEQEQTRWLVLADATPNPVVTELLKLNPESRCVTLADMIRPSLLAHYGMVINCARVSSESIYHDLAVRGIPVIETQRMPRTYSTHAALLDKHLAAFRLGRDLLLAGHTHLAAIDSPGSIGVFEALRQASSMYMPRALIETVLLEHLGEALSRGTTGFICDDVDVANQALCILNGCGARPGSRGEVALAAMGSMGNDVCCSGYYVEPTTHAQAIANVARQIQPNRLSIVWLNGAYVDRGTVGTGSLMASPRDAVRVPSLPA